MNHLWDREKETPIMTELKNATKKSIFSGTCIRFLYGAKLKFEKKTEQVFL